MEMTYTKQELEKKLEEMRTASGIFYSLATQIQCHPFIEMTGFMNEYIKLCEKALEKGIDFTMVSTHTGKGLPMETYEAAYIAEKFDCIFGPTFEQNPAAKKAFLQAAFQIGG